MASWEETYNHGFKINSLEPSKVVQKGLKHIPKNANVLDLGCGNGRNSIFMAKLGNAVDSIDIVDLGFFDKLPSEISKLIQFHKKSVDAFVIKKDQYDTIILTRLIQYLSDDSLANLIKRCSNGLKKDGVILLSYCFVGGITEKFNVDFYSRDIEEVKKLVEKEGLKIVYLEEGSKISTKVPYSANIKSYDIIAVKPKSD